VSPEYDVFTHYFQRRIMDPAAQVYLLDPSVVWEVWDFLQKNSPSRILRNPPSSGFLGKRH
jgi:beta-galactoside alpha-2,6-sialyltransferase (sialyltransferase 1)